MADLDPPPTTTAFILGLIEPAVLLLWSMKYYIIVVFETIFLRGQILAPILRSQQVRDEAFGRFWINFSVQRDEQGVTRNEQGDIDTSSLQGSSALIPPLLQKIRGVVLDVGPGTGTQMPYFVDPATRNDVPAIYGAEPCVGLHADLRKRVSDNGLEGKYHILPCSVEKKELVDALRRDGVQVDDDDDDDGTASNKKGGIFDTIVCIRVLCSVPKPAETIAELYSLLRPGGKMLIVEHVINPWSLFGGAKRGSGGSFIARCLQSVYMALGWACFIGDCCLTRDTETSLRAAAERDGGWESFELEHKFRWTPLPYISGVLVKKQ